MIFTKIKSAFVQMEALIGGTAVMVCWTGAWLLSKGMTYASGVRNI